MGRTFNRAELEEKTKDQLVRLCVDELGIVGITKKPKEDIVNGILALYGADAATVAKDVKGPVTGIEFTGQSTLTKPGAPFGQRATTTIHVSCGASSGNFPVEGKTVKEVGDFLREVLNVDRLSTGLVNGKEVGADYILQNGDNLEFLKPAGKKGC
jgi:hypothetical protein